MEADDSEAQTRKQGRSAAYSFFGALVVLLIWPTYKYVEDFGSAMSILTSVAIAILFGGAVWAFTVQSEMGGLAELGKFPRKGNPRVYKRGVRRGIVTGVGVVTVLSVASLLFG